MSAPPGAVATLTPLTGPRSGDAFDAACRRRDYAALQDAIRHLSKRDAVDHLHSLFPQHSRSWMERHLPYLVSIAPDHFWRLAYNDPTGDAVVRRDERNAA